MLLTHHYNMADAAISRILGAPLATHYAVLGLSANTASASAVKSAFRKAALQVHPDKITDEALKERAANAFRRISEAKEVLLDPSKRATYDGSLRPGRGQPAPATGEKRRTTHVDVG